MGGGVERKRHATTPWYFSFPGEIWEKRLQPTNSYKQRTIIETCEKGLFGNGETETEI